MAFGVNIKILQNDCSKCYFFDQVNTSNLFKGTLYFVRTESLHFDPVVPSNYAEDRNINIDSDSDASIVIIDEVNADDVGEIKDIKIEIRRTSMEIDFLMDRSDTGDERNAEEIPLHYEPIDYSINANKQNEGENPLQSATSDPAVPDGFDYINRPVKLIFQILLVMTPLKRVRENKVYTIRDCVLSDITCDDNGAYNKTNKVKHDYYVVVDEDGVQAVKWIHKSKDVYLYKKRVSRRYIDVVAPTKDVYTLDRYYRYRKTLSGLKMIVIRAISAHNEYVHPYFCVVYSLSGAKPDEVVEIFCAPQGNSKQSRQFSKPSKPYIRTNPSVLAQMGSLLENGTPSNVFHQLLNESGGPIFSNFLFTESRNMTQVVNPKTVKKRKLATKSFASSQSDFERLISEQKDSSSPVCTMVVSGDSYIAIVYTDKQLKDMSCFAVIKMTISQVFWAYIPPLRCAIFG